jgi:lipopolysaccharide export system permease protein
MFTTFDRYLSGRLLHTFAIFFIATYGLFIVIDLFTNIDDFQESTVNATQLALRISEYYLYRTAEFFELAGPVLIVISVMTVLALLQKHSETYPLLAAGIPAFRLLKPLLLSAVLMNAALVVNQEFIIPRIAVQLQAPRGSDAARVQKVEPVYDYSNHLMHIDGVQVLVDEQTLVDATFTLPSPELAAEICTLKAERAVYSKKTATRPAGWLLRNLTGVFDPALLTDEGRTRVIANEFGTDAFVVSDVGFDQLYNRGRNLKLLSSSQLVERIRNPSTGMVPVRGQSLALHTRITRPFLCLLSISVALPLVMRRESRSLILNMTVCAGTLGLLYAVAQASYALGSSGMIRPDLAAWVPLFVSGVASSWIAGLVQT